VREFEAGLNARETAGAAGTFDPFGALRLVVMPSEDQPSVASKIEAIYADAEQSANALREEIEQAARKRAEDVETAAQRKAGQIRAEAEAQAAQYLADCRTRIDTFAEQRIQRLTELTEELIEQAEAIQDRFEAADTVKRQLYDLVAALGRTAEVVAREHADAADEAPVPK
jgi:flagellar biosynthesis/type III secretory pathway protein FliH